MEDGALRRAVAAVVGKRQREEAAMAVGMLTLRVCVVARGERYERKHS